MVSNAGALVFAGTLFVCALTVQNATRNKIGMRCCIFINGSVQAHPAAAMLLRRDETAPANSRSKESAFLFMWLQLAAYGGGSRKLTG